MEYSVFGFCISLCEFYFPFSYLPLHLVVIGFLLNFNIFFSHFDEQKYNIFASFCTNIFPVPLGIFIPQKVHLAIIPNPYQISLIFLPLLEYRVALFFFVDPSLLERVFSSVIPLVVCCSCPCFFPLLFFSHYFLM